MKLSTKTRYSTRAMLELALNYETENRVVSAREIATRQQISSKYLEHLLSSLRAAGLVKSIRGAYGGHTLTKPPDQINLREVYNVFEGVGGFVECTTRPEFCDRADSCVTREVWARIYATCMETLESITFDDLAHRARDKQDEE